GSPGAETWQCTIGTAGFTRNNGNGATTDTDTADWVQHLPTTADIDGSGAGQTEFFPAPLSAAGQPVTVWVKVGYQAQAMTKAWMYYTTDNATFPEGSAGLAKGATQVIALTKDHTTTNDGTGVPEWWKGTLPAQATGTVLRYKIGVHKIGVLETDVGSRFPFSADDVSKKNRMETLFEVGGATLGTPGFNAPAVTVFPHNDLTKRYTGLREGFHVLRTRAFLSRSGKASLFRTNTQTFYYDTQRPAGAVLFPAENATIGGATYGFVVATDESVTSVQFNILDSDAGNNSAANGNGVGNWAAATEVTPTQLGTTGFVREWRFDFAAIPTSGAALVNVRLREASSSSSNALSDAAGWFTTLPRKVSTGVPVNYRIQFPTTDGTVVDASYVAKVYFDKSLGFFGGSPVSAAQMTGEFTITVDGTLIPRAGYAFIANETGTESAISFHFPSLYSGNPDDLHDLRATWLRADISLTDSRLVKAAPGPIADADGDGLPDFWENQNGLDPNNPNGLEGRNGDRDGDGVSNMLEFLAGLNPNDAAEGLVAVTPIISRNGVAWRLQLRTIPNRRYQIETSADLGAWSPAGASFTVPSANAAYLWTDPAPDPAKRFYRARLSLP
ncbi:MAG: thrombospondin type 3 repeat-containing protein, partial [Chthoniobacteraceae bacterium]